MRNGTVLLVGAGLLQVPAIDQIHALGLRVLATDRDPGAAALSMCDESVVLDTKDVAGHVALAKSLAERGDLAAVYTEGADVEVTVAEAAAAVGLPGCSTSAAATCSDKALFRRVCDAAGLPGPRFEEVGTRGDAQAAARSIGFPVIVKALDNSGSRGATKVTEEAGLDAAFEEAMRWTSGDRVLVEECLSGPEQSVETIVADGRHYRCNIVDRPFAYDPYPIEVGHNNPTALDESSQDRLYELVEASARAVGIDLGAAKADTMWTANGPVVLEMTARLSGGFHSQYTSPLAFGTNDIKATLDLALGRPLDPRDVTPRWHRHSICRSLFPPPGVITAIDGIEDARHVPGVEHVLFRMELGDTIPEYRTCVDRPCFVITCAETRAEALAAMDEAERCIAIRTEPTASVA
jgi:biotin carboxylase